MEGYQTAVPGSKGIRSTSLALAAGGWQTYWRHHSRVAQLCDEHNSESV